MILVRNQRKLYLSPCSDISNSYFRSRIRLLQTILLKRSVHIERFNSEALKHKIPIVAKIEPQADSEVAISCNDLITRFNNCKEFSNEFRKLLFDELITKFKKPNLLLPNYLNVPITNLTTEEVFLVLLSYINNREYDNMKIFHRDYLSHFINPETNSDVEFKSSKENSNENRKPTFYVKYAHFIRNKLNRDDSFENNVFLSLVFIDLCMLKFGSVDFKNFSYIERDILNSLRYNIDEYEIPELSKFLTEIQTFLSKPNNSDQLFNEFVTTLSLHESLQPKLKRNGNFINFYWSFKLPAYRTSADLTSLLKHTIIDLKDYTTAIQIYSQYPNLHSVEQFDFILRSYGRIQDWASLQTLFDSLFSYEKLPNIFHYSITMFALASNGHYEECKMLYKQIIDRKMIPSEFIFYSMMLSAFKSHTHKDVSLWFYRYKEFAERTKILSSTPDDFLENTDDRRDTQNGKSNNELKFSPLTIPVDNKNDYDKNDSYPTIIRMYQLLSSGFSKLHKVDLSLKLYKYIQQKYPKFLSVLFATPVIDGYAAVGNYVKMREFMSYLLKSSKDDNNHNNLYMDDILMGIYLNVFVKQNKGKYVESIFRRYSEILGGQQPGIEMYNALLESKIQVGITEEIAIRSILDEMKEKEITLNSRYYELLITFYCKLKDYLEVTGLFEEMENSPAAQGCKPSTVHYRTLMRGCLLNKRYDLVIETYNQMLKKNIFLDSKCHLLLSKAIFRSDSASLSEGSTKFKATFDIINKFFEYSFQNIDEGNYKGMSDTSTLAIVNNCIRFMVAKIDINNAVSILEKYAKLLEMSNVKGESRNLTNYRMSLLRNMILINGSQRNYTSVRKLFDELLKIITESHYVTISNKSNQTIHQVNWKYRSYIVYILRYKIDQLFYDHDFDEVLDLLSKLRKLNLKVDSFDYNNTILVISKEYLKFSDHKFEKVLQFLEEEKFLMRGSQVLKHKRRLIKKFHNKGSYFHIPDCHLSYKSCLQMKNNLREYVTKLANAEYNKQIKESTRSAGSSKEIRKKIMGERTDFLEKAKLNIYSDLDQKYHFAVSNIRSYR